MKASIPTKGGGQRFQSVGRQFGQIQVGQVYLELINPGHSLQPSWEIPECQEHRRAELCLCPSTLPMDKPLEAPLQEKKSILLEFNSMQREISKVVFLPQLSQTFSINEKSVQLKQEIPDSSRSCCCWNLPAPGGIPAPASFWEGTE